jgi:hypothetical protein
VAVFLSLNQAFVLYTFTSLLFSKRQMGSKHPTPEQLWFSHQPDQGGPFRSPLKDSGTYSHQILKPGGTRGAGGNVAAARQPGNSFVHTGKSVFI